MGKNIIKLDIDDCVNKYLKSLKNFKSLKKDEERKYLLDYKINNNLESRNLVIQSNLKYACSLANAYRGKGVDFSELIAEANDGLMEAIEKYDVEQNTKFITYAKWWIIQRITSSIASKYKHNAYDLPFEKDEQDADDDDSLTYNNREHENLIVETIDNQQDNEDIKYYVNKLLNNLTERERDIIYRYYGLYGSKENLFDISKDYNLSSERIRQIIDNSLKKIRSYALCD